MATFTQTIGASTTVLASQSSPTIDADATVLLQTAQKPISSSTSIALKVKEILVSFKLDKAAESDKETNIIITQTVPATPILLTATDLLTGDKVRLVWSGTGPFYNVYYKVTAFGSFIKANANPLPGSDTQYDVGGLTTGTNYTFMVRGVNGVGTESPDSNTLTATPTVDTSASKFQTPTWLVKVNGVTNPDAKLASVDLGYGSDVSRAIFTVFKDPDLGGFPAYNDDIEIYINSRLVLKGKIKGITSSISESGLLKTFTVLSRITDFQEKVVAVDKTTWNVERERENLEINKVKADQILIQVLGFSPAGTPSEFPGEIHLTDQTLLQAAETVLRKLGNFKVFFNQDNNKLEAYKFGQGGDRTRQFIRGVNLLQSNITENREDVVDKLILVGPPRAIRRKRDVSAQDGSVLPDDTGKRQLSFTVSGTNIRDISTTGREVAPPSVVYDTPPLDILPSDFITPQLTAGIVIDPQGRPKWEGFANSDIGDVNGDYGFRSAIKQLIVPFPRTTTVEISREYLTADKVRIFVSGVPKVYISETISGNVDRKKVGAIGEGSFEASSFPLSVRIWRRLHSVPGPMTIFYTEDGARPQITVGSGTVERTLTDTQYQILIDNVSNDKFTNETEVLALMQRRANAEFARLNRPKISGGITIIGDETVDLKSTVLVNGQKLDVVHIRHDLTNGFTTTVTLTNEIFIEEVIGEIPTPENNRADSELFAQTDFRISFESIKVDKNITTQRQEEFIRTFGQPTHSTASYLD